MDSIFIDRLEVHTRIGITETERAKPQLLHVSVELMTDLAKVGASDDVNDTIDYDAVCRSIKQLAATERNTIERFAEDTATMIVQTYAPSAVKVSVWKYILKDTKGVAVTITRP